MLKDVDFSNLEIVSAVKNISDMYDEKSVLITITFVKEEDSYSHLEGIEELVHKTNLEVNGKYIKLQASYIKNSANLVDLNKAVKVAFKHPKSPYRGCTRNIDDAISTNILSDVEFIESVFERSTNDLKKVYL